MRDILEWLIQVEDLARRVYEMAAAAVKEDSIFHGFLTRMAEDEMMHFHFLVQTLNWLKQRPDLTSDLIVDRETIENVERPLREIEHAASSGQIDHDVLIGHILKAEHSEWNHIFLYAMNVVKVCCPHFSVTGPSIQHHVRSIDRFLGKLPKRPDDGPALNSLPPIWRERILVVDDSPLILSLLRSVLERDGIVDTAQNGEEAYLKILENYYAVIISDIDMPVLDGIGLYQKLLPCFPQIQKRFILMSGAPGPGALALIRNEKLTFLNKPFTIREIWDAVFTVMDRIVL